VRNIILLFIFTLIIFNISCKKQVINQKDKVSVSYLLITDYTYERLKPAFEKAIRKTFLETIPSVKRPVSFEFIPLDKTMSKLEEEGINTKKINLNDKEKIEEITNILSDYDFIIFIKPEYIKIEDKYEDIEKEKCSIRKGYGFINIVIYRTDLNKVIVSKPFDGFITKKICSKEIYPDLKIFPKNKLKEDLIYKIIDKLTDYLSKEI